MKHLRRFVCLFVMLCMVFQWGAIAAVADTHEDMMNSNSSSMDYGSSEGTEEPTHAEKIPEETEPAETTPEETNLEETIPEETIPEETASAETTPEETQPEEVIPLPETEEPSLGVSHPVPLLLQTDYPDVPYSDGSVATSGCSMTSIAMVATYLTGTEYYPDDLARRFGNYEASNLQRMESAATVLDLPYEKVFKWEIVVQALTNGKIAIVLVDDRTEFTGTQHFIVLTGITEDGKILVNDPYGPNYDKWELREGFENGFPQEMISTGFSGAWLFNEYTPPEAVDSRYPDIQMTEEEKYLLASIIWLEARGESFEGQQAIAEIVFNRIASGNFSKTVKGTIMAEGQFRTTKFLEDAKPGELQYKAIECAISGPNVLPMSVVFFARYPVNEFVWGQIGGHIFCFGYDHNENLG